MNPERPSEFRKLVSAVEESFRKMQPFRENRKKLIDAFVGSDYAGKDSENSPRTVYLYLLTMAVNIYVRQLAVRAPTAKVVSPYQELRPLAANLTLACKDAADECHLGTVLRECVTDALFSPRATVKIGVEFRGQGKYKGVDVDLTEPFVRKVSFDDYVIDMSARAAGRPDFEGDRYYLSREEFDRRHPGLWAQLGLASGGVLDTKNDGGEDRAEAISHSPGGTDEGLGPKIAMWDIFLPNECKVVTYVAMKAERPVAVIDLDGDEDGAYRSLWFTAVPDNALAMPPMATLKNVHNLANSLFRRLAAQARNQKRVVGFDDEESANRFKMARDGDGVHWKGQKPENIEAGGIDPAVLAFFIQLKDIFSWTAGNLDSLGGLSPMAETAKQDELLARSANAQLADMQEATNEFAQTIFRQIAWYEWTDPVRVRILQKEIPGTDEYLSVEWSPETRRGDFLDFNFSINPHSMREDSPAAKIQKLQGVLMQFYGPLQPFFQQQGLTVDVRRLNELVSDYSNLPELEQLIIAVNPETAAQMAGQGPAGNPSPTLAKAAVTKRTYERINRPGATRVGKDMAMMQTLMGGNPQPSEAAAIGRPVS